jgi:hypothetical protein
VLENIGSSDKLEGFSELTEEDQAMVKKALETKELELPEDVAEAQEKVRRSLRSPSECAVTLGVTCNMVEESLKTIELELPMMWQKHRSWCA